MRQTHLGGEKVFVDFAGDTIDVLDSLTGGVQLMTLFVAAWALPTTPAPRPARATD